MWLGYTSSWETVLDQWNDGNYSNIRPGSPNLPFAGFFQLIRWSEQRAEQKQAELDAIKAESRLRWLAFYYLSRREYGKAELKQKLIDKEQDPDSIDKLLAEFEES